MLQSVAISAGTGKTHVVAKFAYAWTAHTGRRVIGLTTATNAARVLTHEGLAESYNIAQFLGKLPDTGQTRGNIPVHRDDVLVVDEASQVGTADLAAIQVVASQAGARIILTGDVGPAQLRRGGRDHAADRPRSGPLAAA